MSTRDLKVAVGAAFRIHPRIRVAASYDYLSSLDGALENACCRDSPAHDAAINDATHVQARRLSARFRDGEYGSGGLKLGTVLASESVSGVRCYFRISQQLHSPIHRNATTRARGRKTGLSESGSGLARRSLRKGPLLRRLFDPPGRITRRSVLASRAGRAVTGNRRT